MANFLSNWSKTEKIPCINAAEIGRRWQKTGIVQEQTYGRSEHVADALSHSDDITVLMWPVLSQSAVSMECGNGSEKLWNFYSTFLGWYLNAEKDE